MMQFTKATAHQSRLRLALIGPAGSGKTYTALNIAQHLGSKVAVVDTEHGSASKYAGLFAFDVLELASFAPMTYVQAIQAADAAGYDVLVIDSLSHAWMGKGGALEMVDNAAKRSQSGNSYTAWRDVTPQHNAMIDAILASRAHIIMTLRAKMDYVQEKDERGKTIIRKVGLAPIQRDGLEYEADVVGDLDQAHTLIVSKSRCPALADAVIPKPGKELAEQLRAWLGQGEPVGAQPAPVAPTNGHAPQATPPPADTASHSASLQDDDEPPSAHTTAAFDADLDAALRAAPLPGAPARAADFMKPPTDWTEHDRVMGAPAAPAIRFPRNATGMQEFIKLVELPRPRGLGLDADARKDALSGKSVNKYMTDQGWQDDPAALDRVWAELERKVLATEAAEVAATE